MKQKENLSSELELQRRVRGLQITCCLLGIASILQAIWLIRVGFIIDEIISNNGLIISNIDGILDTIGAICKVIEMR